jgi:pantothenate kinase-related protein Tda10
MIGFTKNHATVDFVGCRPYYLGLQTFIFDRLSNVLDMEAVYSNNTLSSSLPIDDVVANFFTANTPEYAHVLFWKFFQCWTTKDCKIKAEISDEEVALFLDQLMDLVAAAYILHQANRVPSTGQQGENHE